MIILTKNKIIDYRDKNYSYKKIGDIFGVQKDVIWKIYNNKILKYRIGIKSKYKDTEYFKIWEIIPAKDFIKIIKEESIRNSLIYNQDQDFLYDFFMDYWTTRLEKHKPIQTLKNLCINKGSYFRICTRNLIKSYSFFKNKKVKENQMLKIYKIICKCGLTIEYETDIKLKYIICNKCNEKHIVKKN